jgi:DNA-directed RNA polymerase subunit L
VPSKTVSHEVVDEMGKTFTKKTDDIMRFHIEGKASISNSTENGHYNPNSCASYTNTIDPVKAADGLKKYIDEQIEIAKTRNITPMTKEQLTRRFELTESPRYFYINEKEEACLFTFKIESVGVIPPLIIFHRAINIIKEKIHNFIGNLISKNENAIKINISDKFSGGYDLIVNDEDDTLGTIIQSNLAILYADFTKPKEQRKLQFIGYKKPHPLEKKIMFSIQGQNDNLDELINDIIKAGCSEIIKMLNKIQNELEGTHQFISELKRIN